MRYHLLATDYDGTLATDGKVAAETVAALEDVLATGRRLVLVTGRELDDLMSVYPDLSIFERVVAENGALLYRPATKERRRLAEPPPPALLAALRRRGVAPLSVGEVIVATREPHEAAVLEAIRELGLELQVIFNKGAVMILPAGVNKATGLTAALEELKISPHNVVGVGDAENDHSFLKLCERSAAVGGALPAIRDNGRSLTARRRRRGRSRARGRARRTRSRGDTLARQPAASVRRRRARHARDARALRRLHPRLRRLGERQVDGRSPRRRIAAEALVPVLRHRSGRRLRGATRGRRHRQARRGAAARRGRAAPRGLRRQRRRVHDGRADLGPADAISRRC